MPEISPQLILLTGLSGAGKSTASHALEDAGFFCIDNFPALLLPDLVAKIIQPGKRRLALVMDTRDEEFYNNYPHVISVLRETIPNLRVIYLEAAADILLRRFSAMRRLHPTANESVRDGIALEKRRFSNLRELADIIIDTSSLTPHQLRAVLLKKYEAVRETGLKIDLLSFGFKHGLPPEADLVFDVRFLANPYFVPELKEMSGQEQPVADYVLQTPEAEEFLARLLPLFDFLIPSYAREGKTYLTIAIGCTGGRHRSVAVAEYLAHHLNIRALTIRHRDLLKR